MPSISVIPAYPVPGKPCRITPAVAPASGKIRPGNAVRIWCTAAPPGSRLRRELDESQASRVSLALAEVGKPLDITFDRGGAYQLILDELQRGSGFSGGYEGDPRGAPTEDIVTSSPATVHVASQLTCRLGFGQDTASLRVFVANANIIATSKQPHGLVTPVIELGAQASTRARTAAENADVRAQLDELVGTASAAIGNVGSAIADLIDEYEAHRQRDSSHENADSSNTVSKSSFATLNSIAGQREALSALRTALTRHAKNIDPASQTQAIGSADYHDGISWSALPIDQIAPSDDPLQIMLALADTWRAYEAHRVSSVHAKADKTNVSDALAPLLELHRLFLAQLASTSPDTPTTDHGASALLASAAGFKDA